VDCAPDEIIDALLSEVGRRVLLHQQHQVDESMHFAPSMNPESARFLKSIIGARSSSVPVWDEEDALEP
jgi:hypothetical protein